MLPPCSKIKRTRKQKARRIAARNVLVRFPAVVTSCSTTYETQPSMML